MAVGLPGGISGQEEVNYTIKLPSIDPTDDQPTKVDRSIRNNQLNQFRPKSNNYEPTLSSPVRHADREWLKISRATALFPTGFSN